MAVRSHAKPAPDLLPRRPRLRVIESRRQAKLHLLTYLVGNALFWTLWTAISVTADRWYWWPILPFGWAVVLSVHLWQVYRHRSEYVLREWRS